MTVIGDVHGEYDRYFRVIKGREATLQLGDMGYNYAPLMGAVDPSAHKFFKGNHDDYNNRNVPHAIGDYGLYAHGGIEFFFVRGAFSIDKKYRVIGRDWFPEEELTYEQREDALEKYIEAKPEIMITHDCPQEVAELIGNPDVLRDFGFNPDTFSTVTQILLQRMLDAHKPKLWLFGHFHKVWEQPVKGTHFRCLPEMHFITISKVGDDLIYG